MTPRSRYSVAALLGLGLTLGALSGCGYVEMHEAVLRPTTGPSSRPVELYVASQTPSRPYYEVALLQAFGYGSDADVEDLTNALRSRAQELGCDGLLRVHFDMGRSMAHGYGVCVRWSQTVQGTVQTTPAPASAPAPEGESIGR